MLAIVALRVVPLRVRTPDSRPEHRRSAARSRARTVFGPSNRCRRREQCLRVERRNCLQFRTTAAGRSPAGSGRGHLDASPERAGVEVDTLQCRPVKSAPETAAAIVHDGIADLGLGEEGAGLWVDRPPIAISLEVFALLGHAEVPLKGLENGNNEVAELLPAATGGSKHVAQPLSPLIIQ